MILRLLLTESGHYVLPVQKDLAIATITDDEKEQIRRLWTGQHQHQPYQATTLEQTDIQTEHKHTGNNHDKDAEKLQFKSDAGLIQNDSKDLIQCDNNEKPADDVSNDGLRTGHQQVADDEPPIQVLMGNDFNMEYDDGVCEYAGDTFPGHLPEGKLRYLQKMYKAVPEEFYSKTKKTPVTPRNARSWMKETQRQQVPLLGMVQRLWKTEPHCASFWTLRSLSHWLQVRLGSISSRTSTHHLGD